MHLKIRRFAPETSAHRNSSFACLQRSVIPVKRGFNEVFLSVIPLDLLPVMIIITKMKGVSP
jgi:hypothetical protein